MTVFVSGPTGGYTTKKAKQQQGKLQSRASAPQVIAEIQKSAVPDEKVIASDESFSGIPVVGMGGSAGSLEAFETFFETMPSDSGAAFVVIQHLAPMHESLLAEILAQHTRMRVVQAYDALPVGPNCVYVIPPNQYPSTLRWGK